MKRIRISLVCLEDTAAAVCFVSLNECFLKPDGTIQSYYMMFS